MYTYKSLSTRFIPDSELPIIQRVTCNGKDFPVFEFHMSGETYYEWIHSYITTNSFDGISMFSFVPRLANEGKWLRELYLDGSKIFAEQWPILYADFSRACFEGLNFEDNKPISKFFVAPFSDFCINNHEEIWCPVKLLVDIDFNHLIDFPNKLTKKELQYLRKSAIELFFHCKKIDDELKKECPKETMTKISNILSVGDGLPSDIIQVGYSVKFDAKIKTCAILAAHSYGNTLNILPNYCKYIETLSDNESGVDASVYRIYEDEIICAFPGSKMNWKDWETNLISQPLGVSQQYDKALEFSKIVMKKYGKDVLFVGHSKGGGEAAYCAASLGAKAIIFNPAWLSNKTLSKLFLNSSLLEISNIQSYVFWNDVLNIGQEITNFACPILNKYVHTFLICDYLPDKMNIGDWHGMKGVLRYFGIFT